MLITNFLYKRLGENVRHCIANYDGDTLPWGILILDETTNPREDYLCIVDAAALERISQRPELLHNTYLFLTADAQAGYEALSSFKDISVYETALATIPLYNTLQDVFTSLGSTAFNRTSNGQDFGAFLYDVLETQVVSGSEIYQQLSRFPTVNDISYRVLVFEFDDPEKQSREASLLMSELPRIFPHCNSALYYGRVVAIIHPENLASDHLEIDPDKLERLQALAEKTGCVCAVSAGTPNFKVLRTQYSIALSVANIGPKIRRDAKQRVFRAEQHMAYVLAELCIKAYLQENPHGEYTYLLHPGTMQLLRYDLANGTDLVYVLKGYLQNDCNASKTAEALCMHRNTVVYKMKKVEELLESPLDDPKNREFIQMSCIIIDYCEKVAGIRPEKFDNYRERYLWK